MNGGGLSTTQSNRIGGRSKALEVSTARVGKVKAQANGRGASVSGGHIGHRGQTVYNTASLRPGPPSRLQTTVYLARFAATRDLLLVRICKRFPSTVPGNEDHGSSSSWMVTVRLCMASYTWPLSTTDPFNDAVDTRGWICGCVSPSVIQARSLNLTAIATCPFVPFATDLLGVGCDVALLCWWRSAITGDGLSKRLAWRGLLPSTA